MKTLTLTFSTNETKDFQFQDDIEYNFTYNRYVKNFIIRSIVLNRYREVFISVVDQVNNILNAEPGITIKDINLTVSDNANPLFDFQNVNAMKAEYRVSIREIEATSFEEISFRSE